MRSPLPNHRRLYIITTKPPLQSGLGQAWLLRAQQTLARIHRSEGSSSSSGDSSGGGHRTTSGTGRAPSFHSSEDARESIRQTIEADARAGCADYVEARGMLLPATEYFQRAIDAGERMGRQRGEVLSLVSLSVLCCAVVVLADAW